LYIIVTLKCGSELTTTFKVVHDITLIFEEYHVSKLVTFCSSNTLLTLHYNSVYSGLTH